LLLKNSNRQSDYSITIFSRRRGRTLTFNVDRRLLYVPLVLLTLLILSTILFGKGFFQEREEKQRLQKRVASLEQLAGKLREAPEKQPEGKTESSPTEVAEPESQVMASGAPGSMAGDEGLAASEESPPGRVEEVQAEALPTPSLAQVDELKVAPLEDRAGFRLDFKLINQADEPISGSVAIIAALKEPHTPRFVSFPSMQLKDGTPVRLRRSVGFSINYFKYVTGRFRFPFSYAESFRILIYDPKDELILDSTYPAEEIDSSGLIVEDR
jgi:hypothetical protein